MGLDGVEDVLLCPGAHPATPCTALAGGCLQLVEGREAQRLMECADLGRADPGDPHGLHQARRRLGFQLLEQRRSDGRVMSCIFSAIALPM